MHRNDEAAKRIAMEGFPPSSPYSQRIAKALQIASSEHDDEVWRTAENGKHFKIETENGEIKKGFGGKMNGKKVSKKPSGSLAKGVTKQNTETAEQFHKAVNFVEKRIDKKPAGTKLKCEYPNDPLRRSSVFVKEADGTWTQHTYAGRIPLGRAYGWTSYMVGAEFVNNVKDTADALTVDGGEGSGNHGHAGIPGHRGGSAKGTGGSAMRAGSKETGYTSFAKNAEFKGIASSASSHKDAKTWFASMTKPQQQALEEQHRACGTKESPEQYYERMHKMLSSRGQKTQKESWKPVEGRDITTSFKRNEKEYPHEINDVIHQQGFDGKPKMMESEEFDQFINDNPNSPLLFRSYTAPDKETLAAYDKQLEEGDWYVDCGTGGAQYGQGMYCVGVYDHTTDDRYEYAVNDEMHHYRELNEQRQLKNSPLKDTSTFISSNQPAYMTCPIDPDKAYKLPESQDDWKKVDDIDPVPGSVYCVKDEYGGSTRYQTLYYGDDGKFHYISDNLRVRDFSKSELKSFEMDTIAECKPYPKDQIGGTPVSTTRRMALDPSAKIITYDNLYKDFNGYKRQAGDLAKNSVAESYKGKNDLVYTTLKSEIPGSGIDVRQGMAAYRSMTDSDLKIYNEAIIKMNTEAQNATVRASQMNIGCYAAMLGYDAINAEGHGETGSYTVVLNRSKLHIDKNAWEVN